MTTSPMSIQTSLQDVLARQDLTVDYLATYLRENTGKLMTDSGDHLGRQYDRPMPSIPAWFDAWKPRDYGSDRLPECDPTMSLAHFLIENCFALPNLQKLFDQYADTNKDPWEDNIKSFFEGITLIDGKSGDSVDYVFVGQQYPEDAYYTYNYSNDFDQDFQFWLLVPSEESEDFQYSERGILVVQSHNGCDARWGFSRPFFLTLAGEPDYLRFPDLKCNYFIDNIKEFPEIDETARDRLEEREQSDESLVECLDSLGFDYDRLSDDKQRAFFRQRTTGKFLEVGIEIPPVY